MNATAPAAPATSTSTTSATGTSAVGDSIRAFSAPVRGTLIAGFSTIAVLLGAGRFIAMDGFAWNVLAIAATAVMFDIAARRSRATRALDVPMRTWLTGAAIVAVPVGILMGAYKPVPWALILGGVATASTWLSWQRNPWYTRYDSFVVTYGDAHFTDTNGEPYLVPDSGTTPWTWTLTILIFAVVFLMAAAIGAAVGMITAAWNGLAALGAVFLVGCAYMAFVLIGLATEFSIGAPYPGVFVFCLPITAVAAGITVAAAHRVQP